METEPVTKLCGRERPVAKGIEQAELRRGDEDLRAHEAASELQDLPR
jgi:hypothetical protein